jgi:hypothetical protein
MSNESEKGMSRGASNISTGEEERGESLP